MFALYVLLLRLPHKIEPNQSFFDRTAHSAYNVAIRIKIGFSWGSRKRLRGWTKTSTPEPDLDNASVGK